MAIDVFLSVGRSTSTEQEEFVKAVESWLFTHDLRPVALGRSEWSSERPLKAIKERIGHCAGAVVIAFERTHISEGVDLGKPEGANLLENEGLPTVWNQIEAAMAYTLGRPLLVIVEDGLVSEGLLEGKYDWIVQSFPLDTARLNTPQALGILDDWKRRLAVSQEARQADADRSVPDVAGRTIGEILGDLRPGQFRALVVATVGSPRVTLRPAPRPSREVRQTAWRTVRGSRPISRVGSAGIRQVLRTRSLDPHGSRTTNVGVLPQTS